MFFFIYASTTSNIIINVNPIINNQVSSKNIKTGKLISKEEIIPVFLRLDSELADKGKK